MSIAGLPTTPMINARSVSAGAAGHPSSSVLARPPFRFGHSTKAGADALSWRRPEAASGVTPSTSEAVTAFKRATAAATGKSATTRTAARAEAADRVMAAWPAGGSDRAYFMSALLDWLDEHDKPGTRLNQTASRQLTRVSALLYRSLYRMSGDPSSVVADGADAESAQVGFQALEDIRAAGLVNQAQFDVLRKDFASRVGGEPAKEVASALHLRTANPSRTLRTTSPPQASPAHGHASLVAEDRPRTGYDRAGGAFGRPGLQPPSNVVGRIQQACRRFIGRL